MTEFGRGNGFILSRSPSTKVANVSALYDPSMMSTCIMLPRESAGNIEYLRKMHESMNNGDVI